MTEEFKRGIRFFFDHCVLCYDCDHHFDGHVWTPMMEGECLYLVSTNSMNFLTVLKSCNHIGEINSLEKGITCGKKVLPS